MSAIEDEAKTKWCPQTMGRAEYGTCTASHCMAWRWSPLVADDAFADAIRKAADELGDTSPSRTKAVKHVQANRAQYGLPTKPFRGYCGLAGEPK